MFEAKVPAGQGQMKVFLEMGVGVDFTSLNVVAGIEDDGDQADGENGQIDGDEDEPDVPVELDLGKITNLISGLVENQLKKPLY